MRKLVNLVAATSLALALLASQSVVVNAATIVGTIDGGGTAIMTDGMGLTAFSIHATLFSDHTARGHIDCVDLVGSAPGYPGNVFGAVTSWSTNPDGTISLHVTNGKLVSFPNGLVVPGGLPFTVTIQAYGGAGVGHWTLDVGPVPTSTPICIELLTSGRLVARWN
ncbi:MAG: hypothetical protein M3O80_09480 [Chloroflexota bacterium]|nr:hypothetical protein [Chloroflexota bacterium]